jgi:tRNA modification GTPase
MLDNDDTIVALSTPAGMGGIGVVRVSGPQALDFSRRLFRPQGGAIWQARPRYLTLGYVYDRQGQKLDQTLAVFFPAPHSYTTQDVVEIQAHGSPALLRRLESLYVQLGARLAQPGEFTLRAFRGGRLSLSQAEAVADLIRARSEQESRLALASLEGGIKRRLQPVRASLLALTAQIEAWLDYPEDFPAIKAQPFRDQLEEELLQPLDSLLHQRERGRIFKEGAQVMLCGRPNAGKSSLFNALLGRDLALVSPLPGTTRDGLQEEILLGGLTCRLRDSAGLGREAWPSEEGNELARLGQQASRAALAQADLVLLLLDGSVPLSEEDEIILRESQDCRRLLLISKADLPSAWPPERLPWPCLPISVRQGDLRALEAAIYQALTAGQGEPLPNQVVVSARQSQLLQDCHAGVQQICLLLEEELIAWELIAWELQHCLRLLGAVDGQGVSDEVLEEIFSTFCLGK